MIEDQDTHDVEDTEDLLPVRMLNEYCYCPRLFYMMHVDGRWRENEFTIDGKHVHRRVDKIDHVLPDPSRVEEEVEGDPSSSCEDLPKLGTKKHPKKGKARSDGDAMPEISRSVNLGSESLGLTARLDLVSTTETEALPVETKRGRVPNCAERCYEPERIQLMAQGLLLREHGYECGHGVLYFCESKTRVDVPFTTDLEQACMRWIEEARGAMESESLPKPLDDSPKCHGCSLNAICLPDETLFLDSDGTAEGQDSPEHRRLRRFLPVRDNAHALFVQAQGARVGKSGETLVVKKKDETLAKVRIKDVSQLVLCGGVTASYAVNHVLCSKGIPIVHVSRNHWFYGITFGDRLRNAYDRAAQFRSADSEALRLAFARSVVEAKICNQRTLLKRNATQTPDDDLEELRRLARKAREARDLSYLLGIEGRAAHCYFRNFSSMLKPRDFSSDWDFNGRNRRPPRDPINALLSFGYALLASECAVAIQAEGLDPWWGLYHRPRHGRPALALDLMEEFRPLLVDSAVVTAVNTGMVSAKDFLSTKAGCVLREPGRKAFLRAFFSRLDQLVTHPIFAYRCSWRTIIQLQARLLTRWLREDIPDYIGMQTR